MSNFSQEIIEINQKNNNYTEVLIQKLEKFNPESNPTSDIEETLEYLFANLEN